MVNLSRGITSRSFQLFAYTSQFLNADPLVRYLLACPLEQVDAASSSSSSTVIDLSGGIFYESLEEVIIVAKQ